MRRLILLLLLAAPAAFPYASYSGFCEQGGQKITVAGQLSVTYLQQSYPNFTQSGAGPSVTVYATGTTNKLTLYSDQAGTPLDNPFPCTSTGQYQFFTAATVTDILFSGSGISSFTRSAIALPEVLGVVSDIGTTVAVGTLCTRAAALGESLWLFQNHNVSTLTVSCNIYFSTGGSITYTGQITFSSGYTMDGDPSQHFIPSGSPPSPAFNGAVAAFYTQWFGPAGTCSGASASRDDTPAVQAAITAALNRTVIVAGAPTSCTVDSTGLFVYPFNAGMTIRSTTGIVAGVYAAGTNGGLVAMTGNAPAAIMTLFAGNVTLQNLFIDCNSGASTNALVSAMGNGATLDHVSAYHCGGDGVQVFNEGTPVTSITAGGGSGSSAVTVAAVTNNQLTFGQPYCTSVFFDYGLTHPEAIGISSVSGNVLNLASPTTNTHTTARCHGNSNDMRIIHLMTNSNGGHGFDVIPGSDQNAFYFEDHNAIGNALGGELWSGSSHKHYGGNYQGDGGYPVQLGTTDGKYETAAMEIGPLGDVEESSGAYNAVASACDQGTTRVDFQNPSQFVFLSTCSGGNAAAGHGHDATYALIVKTISGLIKFTPGAAGSAMIGFFDNTNTLLNTLQISDLGNLAVSAPSSVTDYNHGLEANNGTNCPDCKVVMSYNRSTDTGGIQAQISGSSTQPLALNPNGGAVGVGNAGHPVPTYANNAAAIAGGLTAGQFYRITGADTPGIVH